jgi:membrane protein DedA with SNARE-associated domain
VGHRGGAPARPSGRILIGNVVRILLGWLELHTYTVVFIGVLVDASGVPFPGRLLLIAAGAVAGTGRRSVAAIILLGTVAAMLMDHAWYLAGVWGSERLLRLFRRIVGRSAVDSNVTRTYVARYGPATIIAGRFFTSVRATWPVVAAHVGYTKFLVLDAVGAGLWVSLWVLLGVLVGDRWASAADTAGVWVAIGGAVLLVVAVAPIAARLWRRRQARRPARGARPAAR